jgi:hypothetical protein
VVIAWTNHGTKWHFIIITAESLPLKERKQQLHRQLFDSLTHLFVLSMAEFIDSQNDVGSSSGVN